MACSKIEHGITQTVFNFAKKMVEDKKFTHYSYDIIEDEKERKKADTNILCYLINYIYKNYNNDQHKLIMLRKQEELREKYGGIE